MKKAIIILICVLCCFASGCAMLRVKTPDYWTDYFVQEGDTLWNIAITECENIPKYDTRLIVNEIKKRNNCTALIHVGDYLELPNWICD